MVNMMKLRTACVVLSVAFLWPAAPVKADPVSLEGWGPFLFRPGDVLRAEFDLRGLPPNPDYASYNVLLFVPGVTQLQPVTSFTTRLYDRGQLLGTYTALLDPDRPVPFGSWFTAPGSGFTLGNPTVVDFTSLQNGTFDGAVEFEILGGLANLYRVSDELDFDLALGPRLASGSGFAPRTYQLIRSSSPAPVPEPASLLLMAVGGAEVIRRKVARGRRTLTERSA
jgi:hypothetical protein